MLSRVPVFTSRIFEQQKICGNAKVSPQPSKVEHEVTSDPYSKGCEAWLLLPNFSDILPGGVGPTLLTSTFFPLRFLFPALSSYLNPCKTKLDRILSNDSQIHANPIKVHNNFNHRHERAEKNYSVLPTPPHSCEGLKASLSHNVLLPRNKVNSSPILTLHPSTQHLH